MKIKIVLALAALSLAYRVLQANLDGTVSPIIMDTKYTFTNNEVMKGLVYLNAGCDLPVNGTVTFNVASGTKIEGAISGTNSTIVFKKNTILGHSVRLFGSFFFKSDSKTVVGFSGIKTIQQLIPLGNIVLEGTEFCELRQSGVGNSVLDLSNSALTDCTIRNMTLIGSLKTSSSGLNSLNLENVDIIIGKGTSLTVSTPNLKITGQCSLTTFNTIADIQGLLYCDQSGALSITPLTRVKVAALQLRGTPSRLVLQNCDLDISNQSASGSNIILGASLGGNFQGQIIVEGQTTIRSSNKNKLLVPAPVDILLLSGSKLIITNGTHLVVY